MDIIILYILIMSVSFFCAGIFRKRFEETLPLSFIFIMLSLFIFGLLDQLKFGVYGSILLLSCLYIATIYFIIVKHRIKEMASYFFTPSFFIFTFLFAVLIYADYGKLADSWDEFSHWMDCVKAMSSIDHFVTSPESRSNFQSYPPAMALLQYFSQKIFMSVHKGAEFNEWRMYLVYQLFALSIFFPFLKNVTRKKLMEILILPCILFLLPLVFFNGLYAEIWIDPFVAILAGCGFARVLYYDKDDSTYHLYIMGICMTLVLAKDIGLFFGFFVGIAYMMDRLIRELERPDRKKISARGGVLLLIRSSMPIIALGVVKLLWKMELKTSGASIRFQNKIDLYKYTSMFLFHNDDTYHQKVVDNFKDAFYSYQISLSGTNIVLNFFSLFCILILLLYLLYYIIKKQKRFIENKAIKWIFLLVIVQVLLYIYSLGAVYIANFDEYEAVNLASYSRYCNMTFLAVWIVLVLGAVTVISESIDKRKTVYLPVLFVVILLISPMKNVSDILNRDRVRSSIAFREPFEKLNYLIRKNCDGSDRIYFISQGDRGQDYWVTRFNARPNFVVTVFGGWNLGGPFYETDYETIHLTSSEWQTILLTENYDYVALYRLNDYFIQSYADLFMNPSDMVDNALFRVDKETGMLVRCEG